MGRKVGAAVSLSYIVLDGDPAPLKRGTAPHFSARVFCGETVGWIKISLGLEVIGLGEIVLDGDPSQLLLSTCSTFLRSFVLSLFPF